MNKPQPPPGLRNTWDVERISFLEAAVEREVRARHRWNVEKVRTYATSTGSGMLDEWVMRCPCGHQERVFVAAGLGQDASHKNPAWATKKAEALALGAAHVAEEVGRASGGES